MTCSSMFLLDSEQVNPSGVIESVAICSSVNYFKRKSCRGSIAANQSCVKFFKFIVNICEEIQLVGSGNVTFFFLNLFAGSSQIFGNY